MAHEYGKHGEGSWPVRVNVRVRRREPLKKPKADEVWKVLEAVARTGRVPAGWSVAAVDWQGFVRRGRESFGPGAGDALARWPETGTGWRHGKAADIGALLAPMMAGDVQIGWERRPRKVKHKEPAPWVRWRSRTTGRWVSAAYARRYPHRVFLPAGEEFIEVEETVYDYEAEVRTYYE